MGNGAKAQQKRDRAGGKPAPKKDAKSQLKVNEAAKNIVCQVCRQPFMSTTREPALLDHVEKKHPEKTRADCFP
ncbi:DUF1909-domain-containing protein [Rickenella mellea]|uniref:DUF1909-domain-containing protein n=1 Tax=Rickenella mellea TaxID=50990 RepID=A0A4Y7QMW9_9AGAM|nr:DUF1909-domain-containing protein [Rickenella mellea]